MKETPVGKLKYVLLETLQINPDYLALVPRPNAEEYEAIKEDIARHGLKDPLKVNEALVVIDGHTRHKIATELEILEVPVLVMSFPGRAQEEDTVIELNLHRRNLTRGQKIELGLRLLEFEKQRARERQLAGLKQFQAENSVDPKLDERTSDASAQGQALDIIAKRTGVSRGTLHKGVVIKEAAQEDPEIAKKWDAVVAGKQSVHSLYQEVKKGRPLVPQDAGLRAYARFKEIYQRVLSLDPKEAQGWPGKYQAKVLPLLQEMLTRLQEVKEALNAQAPEEDAE